MTLYLVHYVSFVYHWIMTATPTSFLLLLLSFVKIVACMYIVCNATMALRYSTPTGSDCQHTSDQTCRTVYIFE